MRTDTNKNYPCDDFEYNNKWHDKYRIDEENCEHETIVSYHTENESFDDDRVQEEEFEYDHNVYSDYGHKNQKNQDKDTNHKEENGEMIFDKMDGNKNCANVDKYSDDNYSDDTKHEYRNNNDECDENADYNCGMKDQNCLKYHDNKRKNKCCDQEYENECWNIRCFGSP